MTSYWLTLFVMDNWSAVEGFGGTGVARHLQQKLKVHCLLQRNERTWWSDELIKTELHYLSNKVSNICIRNDLCSKGGGIDQLVPFKNGLKYPVFKWPWQPPCFNHLNTGLGYFLLSWTIFIKKIFLWLFSFIKCLVFKWLSDYQT
jgi:hypothetical protein